MSIASMDLAFAVVLNKENKQCWTKWFIVFMATLLGLVLLYTLDRFSTILFSGMTKTVLNLIWDVFITADAAFLCTFSWYFINWMIARPMPRWEKLLAYCNGLLFIASSVLFQIFSLDGLSSAKYAVGTLAVGYIIAIIIRNYQKIDNRRVKIVCFSFVIVSLAIIPLIILSIAFTALKALMLPLMALSYLICFLVFLSIALEIPIVETKQEKFSRKELSIEDVQCYGITQREFEVILLIKKGLTNKEIANELTISVNTVNNHIANIFDKTEVRSRIDLLNLLQEADW